MINLVELRLAHNAGAILINMQCIVKIESNKGIYSANVHSGKSTVTLSTGETIDVTHSKEEILAMLSVY